MLVSHIEQMEMRIWMSQWLEFSGHVGGGESWAEKEIRRFAEGPL